MYKNSSNNIGKNAFLNSKHNSRKETCTFEGGKAYNLDLEEKICNAFTLGLIQGSFYISQEDIIKNAKELFEEALNKMPELATKYAVYASEELGMKFMPTLWLVYISTLTDKTLFHKAFPRIIGKSVKLMHDFVDICRNSDIRPGGIHNQKIKDTNKGLGQGIKKTINNHAYNILNEYNACRFTGDWEDIFRLTRIEDKKVSRIINGKKIEVDTKPLLQYIFKPYNQSRRLIFDRAKFLQETIDILQNKNRSAVEFVTALENIKKYKLQMDEIKFTFGKLSYDEKKKVYEYFIPGLRYTALVTNLVSIERAFATNTRQEMKLDPMGSGKLFKQTEVLETNIPDDLIKIVADKLSNFEDYKQSKLLFFRLLSASKLIITSEWIKALNKVLSKAGEIAFADISNTRKIRCGADTSGSMYISVGTNLKAVEVASFLTASVALSIPSAKAYALADYTKEVPLSNNDLIDCAKKIAKTDVGYGTNFESLLNGYNGEDIVIIVTDGEQSDNMENKWIALEKQNRRPKNSKLIVWQTAGGYYNHKISKDNSIIYLRGYNDSLLNILNNIISGKAGQMDIARNVKL